MENRKLKAMVSSFSESEIDDIVEEETLLHLDFDTVLDDGMFQHNSLFKIIALESEEPFVQIGSQMYSGTWLDTVGTHLFFESEVNTQPSDPVFSDAPSTVLNYKFKTRKCLELSRVFINQKNDNADDMQPSQNENTKVKTTDSRDIIVDSFDTQLGPEDVIMQSVNLGSSESSSFRVEDCGAP